MKKLVLMLLLIPFLGKAQTYNYAYDATGNRVARAHVQLKKGSSAADTPATEPFTDQFAALELRLYPNPTQDQLHIDANGDALELNGVLVFDSNGNLVMEHKATALPLQIDFSQHPTGLYTVVLQATEETKRYKILVTR